MDERWPRGATQLRPPSSASPIKYRVTGCADPLKKRIGNSVLIEGDSVIEWQSLHRMTHRSGTMESDIPTKTERPVFCKTHSFFVCAYFLEYFDAGLKQTTTMIIIVGSKLLG